VLGIAPFNFPLNLVAHKVASAVAVGAPIVLEPAPATPLTALLGELLAETDLPAGSWSILPVPNEGR
jgi:aldehyde dehydrogenase (NAD+)